MRRPVVLVSPLNWGLGHATRCVPIVRALIEHNAEVIVGADGNAAAFLKKEFPNLEHVSVPDVEIKYYRLLPAWLSILFQMPKLIHHIYKENIAIKAFLKNRKIDVILSDNRYGVRSKNVKSIILTHQLQVKSEVLGFLPNFFIRKQISKFNQCLVPDFENEKISLAGKLSHPSKYFKNTNYIGVLSRFSCEKSMITSKIIPIIMSGPEPLKTKIIQKLMDVLSKTDYEYILLSGNIQKDESKRIENIEIVSHLETREMEIIIKQSPLVIATGGYSSIMDFYSLNKKAILIPFPGQTEQVYLSKHHKASKQFSFIQFSKLKQLPELIKVCLSNLELNRCNKIDTISSEELSRFIVADFLASSKMINFDV